MNADEKFNLITNNLEEVMNEKELVNIIKDRDIRIYWGISPIKSIDIGILLPLAKIAELLKAECQVTILFADLHGFLDSSKHTWNRSTYKIKYYKKIIKIILNKFNTSTEKLKFIIGSEYQFIKNYTFDFYKLMSIIPTKVISHAVNGVIKKRNLVNASSIIYPVLQILDEEYLKIDAQLGGYEQKKIFELSDKYLPKLGYSKKVHLITPFKCKYDIGILDSESKIEERFDRFNNDQILKFIKYVIFPTEKLNKNKIIINNQLKYTYHETFIKDYNNDEVNITVIKPYFTSWLTNFLQDVSEKFNQNDKNKRILKLAFQ